MRSIGIALALAGMIVAQTAQENDRVFELTHGEGTVPLELGNTIRAMTGIRQATPDAGSKTLTVRGNAAQIEMAQWLVSELDKTPVAPQWAVSHEYRVPGSDNDSLRVIYLANSGSPQALQEAINAVRAVSGLARVMPSNLQRAIVLRGSVNEADLAETVAKELDKPAGQRTPSSFPVPGSSTEFVRVLYLGEKERPQQVQELVNAIRAIAEITRMLPYNPKPSIVIKARENELLMAEFLYQALDQPKDLAAVPEYQGPRADDTVRVYYLPRSTTPARQQEIINAIRATTGLTRLMPYTAQIAVAMRGTGAQLSAAAQLIQQQSAQTAQK